MADTPAPLPSLGLLDGLGSAAAAGNYEPAPLPSLSLVGGFSAVSSGSVEDPGLVFVEGNPLAFLADPGFAGIYVDFRVGIPQANRDDVAEAVGNQGGDAAFLPHIGLLFSQTEEPPDPEPETLTGRKVRRGRTKFLPPAEETPEEVKPAEKVSLVSEEAMYLLVESATETAGKAVKKARITAQKKKLEIQSQNVKALDKALMEWF